MRPASPFHVGPVNFSPVNVWQASQPNLLESALPWAMSAGVTATVMLAYGLPLVLGAFAFTVPRISPPGFAFVWTFTYALPAIIAAAATAVTDFVPPRPDRQGPHSGTTTLPAFPGAPRWTCAAIAGPVRRANFSFQVRVALVVLATLSVPVKVPVPLVAPFGRGTSSLVLSFVFTLYEPGVSLVALPAVLVPEWPVVASPPPTPRRTIAAATMTVTLSLLFT